MQWYLNVLKNYVGFSGRARRKEYWMFTLINLIVAIIALMLDRALGLADAASGYGPIYGVYALAVLLPTLAVAVRRLHDTNRSGWWLLLGLIPLIGALVLLVWMVLDGTAGDNRFGSNPKTSRPGTAALA